jgi:hypothetical protein
MNEVALQFTYLVMNHYGGIENITILALSKKIIRTIMSGINYLQPGGSLQVLLLGRGCRDTGQGNRNSKVNERILDFCCNQVSNQYPFERQVQS